MCHIHCNHFNNKERSQETSLRMGLMDEAGFVSIIE